MKKLLLFLILPVAILASCSKINNVVPFDNAKQAVIDNTTIQAYLTAHPQINAIKDTTGVYYQVITQGTGDYASVNSTITVAYTGTLLNGSQFDASSNFASALKQLIPGWQIGLPYLKAGGRILLIIPSRYGYGNQQAGSIPANSVLLFTIDLKAVSSVK